jgi:hypothetical protein
MGGGLMQLVAYGAQDIYLTGNPQITFFKVVYRRHTNFAMECVEQTLNGSAGNGASVTATISRNGDLVGKMYVTSSTVGITDGDSIIDQVDVEIGGQRIDRHYKEWLQVWAELTTPDSKALAYKNMTGALSHGLNSTNTAGVNMVQIPLQFWFNRNPGLALPLIALQYHEVKIKMTLGSTTGTAGVKLWADYIYLDTDERRRFAQVSHEYLIEQLQREDSSSNTTHKLNFNHPVKELVWTSDATNSYETAKLVLNGHDRFAAQEEEYFQLRQPMDCHTAVPGANIPMCDRPVMLSTPIIVSSGDAASVATIVTADNTFEVLAAATSNLKLYSAAAADIDIKVGDVLLISYPTAADHEVSVHCVVDAVVTAPADGAVAIYTLSFNAGMGTSDTFVDGAAGAGSVTVVARLQDPLSRCSQLNKKINVYSFALKPEEHQPSGTCNFSRIDNAQLTLNVANAVTIYAVNYNVLRVMSGMGGLAYSN